MCSSSVQIYLHISIVFIEDAQSSQADVFPSEKQNSSQAPTDPETSVIQVKLELSTMQQDLELPKQSCPSLACSPERSDRAEESHHDISGKRLRCLCTSIHPCMHSCGTVKFEEAFDHDLELHYKPDLPAHPNI